MVLIIQQRNVERAVPITLEREHITARMADLAETTMDKYLADGVFEPEPYDLLMRERGEVIDAWLKRSTNGYGTNGRKPAAASNGAANGHG